MEWFEEFMKETVRLWTDEEHGDIPLVANYLKSINESRSVISKFIGDKGEDYALELIEKKGYTVHKTPRSWSDSDLFALSENMDGFIHLMLVQVKATELLEEPKTLDEDQIDSLKNYSAFVLKRWFESELVPKKNKGTNLILSCGYVGVIIKNDESSLFSPEAYQFLYHNTHVQIKDEIKNKIATIHKL